MNLNLFFLAEDRYLNIEVILAALMMMFIVVNIRRTLHDVSQRKQAAVSLNPPNRMAVIAIKTILFLIFYGFGVVHLVANNKVSLNGVIDSVTSIYCSELFATTGNVCNKYAAAIHVIAESALVFNPEVIAWNLFYGLYLFTCYFYFNLHLGFATLIVFFSSRYFNNNGYSFIMAFGIISFAIAVAFFFYKVKSRMLNIIRYLFTMFGRSKMIRIIEFYVICMPYFVFSLALSALNVGYCNIIIQVALVHLLAYFTLYRLYREGCDIGFDYDPW